MIKINQGDDEPAPQPNGISLEMLNSINVEQASKENRAHLISLGGVDGLSKALNVSFETGLRDEQVLELRKKYGTNQFADSPQVGFFKLLLEALSDTTLIILLVAAGVSMVIDIFQEGLEQGWIQGGAIFIAVFLVANITATNNYFKGLQFRALEHSTAEDERCSVFRNGIIRRINPKELVVGDIVVMQAGDQIPADCVIIDRNVVFCNEASLTGEPDDVKKSKVKDCFLLSSCLITDGEEVRGMVICVGNRSQWGKIKANLTTESVNTPLQDKLQHMTEQIGYIGMVAAFFTFATAIISIWARHNGDNVEQGFLDAFILCVTIIVVAIPEGLPLAVTISLAYSMTRMRKDQCLIRVLAACETMGNATTICSDKTGTLTLNIMTVVEGWFADEHYDQESFKNFNIPELVQHPIVENCCINRTAYLIYKDGDTSSSDRPTIIGNKTEGALILMAKAWGYNYELVKNSLYHDSTDKVFSFNSSKKRSTAVIRRSDGSYRLYCKGASEYVLRDCTMYMSKQGKPLPMTPAKKTELAQKITLMADQALRTLVLAHKDYENSGALPSNWEDNPPDNDGLCCDCIVGIIDPVRPNVKEAVATAQKAGVLVRMVTGDNLSTASAIARQCGILTPDGICLEGPVFRKMKPKELDVVLPRLQVLARSSPEDKFLLVSRLNGHSIPSNREEWEARFRDRSDVSWDTHRDLLLPGYREEWESSRPDGGHIVGVTGDGTNDAPALKAADVGLAMGLSGTKVACSAADIVILDDDFNSIVRAILWGRAIYDNIRKFLQFQLTVNCVALALVFISVAGGFEPPINAIQMLWVNLVMDTFGALALGTEAPTQDMLNRKPYKRSSSLLSLPMRRNILCMSGYMLTMLLTLLYTVPRFFNVLSGTRCLRYTVAGGGPVWDAETGQIISSETSFNSIANTVTCADFRSLCSPEPKDELCFYKSEVYTENGYGFYFKNLHNFQSECLTCAKNDYTFGTILFNTFIFLQIFNEYTARSILSDWKVFSGLLQNHSFIWVSVFTIGAQIFLVELGGDFMKTSPLSLYEWLITVALGFSGLLAGILMRFLPVNEDPNSFHEHEKVDSTMKKDYTAMITSALVDKKSRNIECAARAEDKV